MTSALSIEMKIEEKHNLPSEMFVSCRDIPKKQIPNSNKGEVECPELLVMLIEV